MLLLIILLLNNLNRKTNTFERVARFKLETLKKINTDSLNAEGKLDFVVDETTKFSEKMVKEPPSIRQSVRQLIRVVSLLIIMEFIFFIAKKRKVSK
jgi:hypothetical protein